MNLTKISLNFVPKDQMNIISALVQIMAWCRRGHKSSSAPMKISLLTHICVTRPQCVMILFKKLHKTPLSKHAVTAIKKLMRTDDKPL